MLVQKIRKEFKALANPEKARDLTWFFKTGKGDYGEGDRFWGVMSESIKTLAKKYFRDLDFKEAKQLLSSDFHEERMLAVRVLGCKFEKGNEKDKESVYRFYLKNAKRINNWDLVDVSAPGIVGGFLTGKSKDTLQKLAKSKNLWERRIAIVATFTDIRNKNCETAFKISKILLSDKHDLIHKAVGWMLRECGKNCGEAKLEKFLTQNIRQMPRTTLRYAIERFGEKKRLKYMKM